VSRHRALPQVAPRPTPAARSERVNQIVAAARQIVEAEGADALTMRRLADELGIKAPSLYKHLPGRDAVVAQLVDETLFDTGDQMHAAVDSPAAEADGPVQALLAAYRKFGRARPNLYRLVTQALFSATHSPPASRPGLANPSIAPPATPTAHKHFGGSRTAPSSSKSIAGSCPDPTSTDLACGCPSLRARRIDPTGSDIDGTADYFHHLP
jgi:AcrR family transcriptional regulator